MIDKPTIENVSKYFGSYKAEWLKDSLYDLYTEPTYFPELTTPRPCVLVGGRGTGKTTVLRSLSYEGQYELIKRTQPDINEASQFDILCAKEFVGFYYRVSTPRVSAFQGGGVERKEWQKLFHHYINITFAYKTFQFLCWHHEQCKGGNIFNARELALICRSLALEKCSDEIEIMSALEKALIEIESYINNIGLDDRPRLSVPTALEQLYDMITQKEQFIGKTFFLIIDEYENFQNDQQQVINTLIKHTSTAFTFKIGVRYLGWRIKCTLNETEILISPSDYVLVDISTRLNEADFAKFAENVCNARISGIIEAENAVPQTHYPTVRDILPSISAEDEAALLGVEDHVSPLRAEIKRTKDKDLIALLSQFTDLDIYVLDLWASGEGRTFHELFEELQPEQDVWNMRIAEYKYSALFNIKTKKAGIKKYYSGWGVFLKLSAGNIRYLLELFERALNIHLREGNGLDKAVSYRHQTEAAQFVGKKNLEELSGLSIYGAKLTKLVLGLGRIFQVLAEDSAGHAPEVNQFRIKAENSHSFSDFENWLLTSDTNASRVLQASVMHLALIPFPGNKPKGEGDIRDSTYQLHPIFSPYFIFSYRKRRNLILEEDELLNLIEKPRETIPKIISRQNRNYLSDIPGQLKLFEEFWD